MNEHGGRRPIANPSGRINPEGGPASQGEEIHRELQGARTTAP